MVHPRHEELKQLIDACDVGGLLAIASLDDIATAWCSYNDRRPDADDDPDWWAVDLLMLDEFWADRDRLRAALLKLIEQAPNQDVLGGIGAGPLEDFVSDDEDDLSWLEVHARDNPGLRFALSNVWCDGSVSEATMARLDAAVGEPLARRRPREEWPPALIAFDDAEQAVRAVAGDQWWILDEPTAEQERAIREFLLANHTYLDAIERRRDNRKRESNETDPRG